MFPYRKIGPQTFWLSAFVLLLLILFIVWTRPTAAQNSPPISPVSMISAIDPPLEYAPRMVIVKLKPGVQLAMKRDVTVARIAVSANNAALDQALRAISVSGVEPIFIGDVPDVGRASIVDNPLRRIYRLHLASTTDVSTVVELLRYNDAVEYAEPDYIARATLIPNDPEWSNQWALSKINAPTAWEVTQGASTTIIALIDSGIDLAHPDLSGRVWQNDEIAGNGLDDDQNGKIDDVNGWNFVAESNHITDTNGHGTQVAGVAGAATNNALGVAGLCWQCPLMPVVAMQANGVANYSTIANAVLYAAANGASVINLSLGGYADSSLLREAIGEAATTAVIVAAAGNDDGVAPFYPAAYPNVIAVAATGTTDQKAVFSNYGPWIDLAAPGDLIQTTTLGNYAAFSGTSVAAPFVSGVAGLLKSLRPDWSPALITWQLLNTAMLIDEGNPTYSGQLGYGRLDAGAALTQAPQARVQVEGYTVDGQGSGRPAPGQSFPLVLTVRNTWMPGQSLIGTLITSDTYVAITDNLGAFGDIGPGETGRNSSDPFVVTLQPNTSYNRNLPFLLNLTGANGYTTNISFTLQVRTAVETLGNTQYTQNTTWTSDKTYVLNGTIIVSQGITLTIQPGTVVKGNPGKFIRVDGTVVAQGTEQNPILFTTNAANSDKWGGLRFADTAVSASFDGNGNYIAGSILRNVAISHATTGVNLGTSAPYVSDSTLHNNEIALQSNSNAPKIEKNIFRENVRAITLMGGSPIIFDNHFIRNKNGTMGSAIDGSGSPQILGNTFVDEQGFYIIRLAGGDHVIVRDNRIVDNVGGLWFSSIQTVAIEENLIADNRAFCVTLTCASAGIAALTLELQSASNSTVLNNTIINNSGVGLWLRGSGASLVAIANNNLFGNHDYDFYLQSGSPGTQNFTVNATNNFWNVDTSAIAGRIHDCTFDENGCGSPSSTLGKVHHDPPLTEPSQTAPAFIRRATMNPDTVGLNQIGTMTIDFSRPMIIETMPLVSFHDARRGTQQVMANESARVIAQDITGRMWFSRDLEKSLAMFDGGKWYTYTVQSGLGDGLVGDIYSAKNGDVWVGHYNSSTNVSLSRMQGYRWITYTNMVSVTMPILSIAQNANGVMWFGGQNGALSFDGSTWKRYTTTQGLSSNIVRKIVIDSQDREWFWTGLYMTENEPGGLDVFDGTTWQTYNKSTGMTTNGFSALFADSQGRIWVGLRAYAQLQYYVSMFDGSNWHFYGPNAAGTAPSCTIDGFAEAPDGSIWMSNCGNIIAYQDGTWARITGPTPGYTTIFFDDKENLWYNSGNNLMVRWKGLNYPFENGQWLSPTRYQSTYNFNAWVPQGVYAVDVNGALDNDGSQSASGAADTFRVDFGIAANPTPPVAPAVTAENNGTLTTISARWRTDSPEIDYYRYAIGTTPGARNVVGWTYLTTNSMVRSDLSLIQGQSYYVSVQARNKFGLWSASGVSNQVIGGVVTLTPAVPTPTPLGGIPVLTPTLSGGTPIPTPTLTPTGGTSTPTSTPVPLQILAAVGENNGAPGSRFIFTGSGFPPNTQLPVAVTPLLTAVAASPLAMVGTVTTDANGNFTLTLATATDLPTGRYRLTVGDTLSATVAFEISQTAPLRQPAIVGAVITMAKQLYLPLIHR